MKDFKINRNSWHYKLNQHFLNEDGHSEMHMKYYWEPKVNNFCAYWRATIMRLMIAIILTVLIAALLASFGFLVYNDPIGFAFGFTAVFGIILGVFAITMGFSYLSKKGKNIEKSNGLFATKYKSFKSKFCPGVDFKD